MPEQPSEPERVVVEISEHVAHVRLNRPDKRNGVDLAMFEALVAMGERLGAEPSVRAVVLSGAGASFCAGLDFASFLAMGPASARLLAREPGSPANLAQRACWVWTELRVPVVAAIRGAAFGAGLQLALACDVRLVADDARLSVMEIRYGLIPDMTASKTLLRLVRSDVARELVYTGRVVEAAEAVAIGLATRACADPVADALALARAIAQQSPSAIRASKRLCVESGDLDTVAAFSRETELQLELLGKPEQLEAVAAMMGKRAPAFGDPP
jgi:enoyl-CoA hydratase/carnithine racemase